MKPAKPHFLIRLIDGIADRAFRTAAAATPIFGSAAVGVLRAGGDSVEAMKSHPLDMPPVDEFDHPLWEDYWGAQPRP